MSQMFEFLTKAKYPKTGLEPVKICIFQIYLKILVKNLMKNDANAS